jgi:hypothetical protein
VARVLGPLRRQTCFLNTVTCLHNTSRLQSRGSAARTFVQAGVGEGRGEERTCRGMRVDGRMAAHLRALLLYLSACLERYLWCRAWRCFRRGSKCTASFVSSSSGLGLSVINCSPSAHLSGIDPCRTPTPPHPAAQSRQQRTRVFSASHLSAHARSLSFSSLTLSLPCPAHTLLQRGDATRAGGGKSASRKRRGSVEEARGSKRMRKMTK